MLSLMISKSIQIYILTRAFLFTVHNVRHKICIKIYKFIYNLQANIKYLYIEHCIHINLFFVLVALIMLTISFFNKLNMN